MKNRFLFNGRTGHVLRTRRGRSAEALCIALAIVAYILLQAYMGKCDELADMELQLQALEVRYAQVAASPDQGCPNVASYVTTAEVLP